VVSERLLLDPDGARASSLHRANPPQAIAPLPASTLQVPPLGHPPSVSQSVSAPKFGSPQLSSDSKHIPHVMPHEVQPQ
jgi:hypothetical protein